MQYPLRYEELVELRYASDIHLQKFYQKVKLPFLFQDLTI